MARIKLTYISPKAIKPRERAWRKHSPEQIKLLRRSLVRFEAVEPVLIDSQNRVVCGSAIVEAAIAEGIETIPVVRAEHLTDDELRAYAIAANKLADLAGYDMALLAEELQEIASLLDEPDLSGLGFEPGELDRLLGLTELVDEDGEGMVPALNPAKPIAALHDLWQIGPHRLACADAVGDESLELLMQGEKAQLVLTDPPWNRPTRDFSGRGRVQHPNFLQGSGEMSPGQYTRFLTEAMRQGQKHMVDGALGLWFIDSKHLLEMLRAGSIVFGTSLDIITWIKSQGGLGSTWRSQTEFVVCFKNGEAPHVNNVMLGKYGRNRTNAWFYDGMNTPGRERDALLAMHPCCKPVQLLADAILDVSTQGSIVLDSFAGSGSLILAAERVKRRAYALELDPLYVDVALRRARSSLGIDPVRVRDGARLSELEEGLAMANKPTGPSGPARKNGRVAPPGYRVGPYCPPIEYEWEKGCRSPNPFGRPAKKRLHRMRDLTDPIAALVFDHGNGKIPLRGDGQEAIPRLHAVLDALLKQALTGSTKAAQLYIQQVQEAATVLQKKYEDVVRAAMEHKKVWLERFIIAEAAGAPLPSVFPDPRDIIVDSDEVRIIGPIDLAGKIQDDRLLNCRDLLIEDYLDMEFWPLSDAEKRKKLAKLKKDYKLINEALSIKHQRPLKIAALDYQRMIARELQDLPPDPEEPRPEVPGPDKP